MSPKRIVLLSFSAGLGHIKAAEALASACRFYYPEIECTHWDVANFCGRLMRWAITSSYGKLVNRWPRLYGLIYRLTDSALGQKSLDWWRPIMLWQTKKLRRQISAFNPGLIIATHFLPPYFLRPSYQGPIDVVITDYCASRVWLAPTARNFFVATEDLKKQLEKTTAQKIIAGGLPVRPEFKEEKNIAQLKTQLGIAPNKPTVLILPLRPGKLNQLKIVERLAAITKPMNVAVITGGTAADLTPLLNIMTPININYIARARVDNLTDYLRVADVVITKPGGMTIAETLALNKPLLLVSSLPGQEQKNADYLIKIARARLLRSESEIVPAINGILPSPQSSYYVATTPDACQTILQTALQ